MNAEAAEAVTFIPEDPDELDYGCRVPGQP